MTTSTDYTLVGTEKIIEVDASGGAVTITFPPSVNSYQYVNIIKVDSTSNAVNISDGKTAEKDIRFLISDNLSGISSYSGKIDGQWVLFEYDAKSNLLKYKNDLKREQKEHFLVLVVYDERKNGSTYTTKFIY